MTPSLSLILLLNVYLAVIDMLMFNYHIYSCIVPNKNSAKKYYKK